jgi:hypothetical protein
MSWDAPDHVHLMSSPATMEPAFRQIRGQCVANSFQDNPARLAKKFCHREKFGSFEKFTVFLWFFQTGLIVLSPIRLKICEWSSFAVNS